MPSFPLIGFSINTLSLFGLVLAIGLVVDDAIVVVEAVEHHIEGGMSPRDATLKAMEEVSGPVVAIALILFAVFVPTAFIPGITGRLYQQFAVTIAVSMLISAFNALSLSPAPGGDAVAAPQGTARAGPLVLRRIQPMVRARDGRLRQRLRHVDPQDRVQRARADRGRRGGRCPWREAAERFPSRRKTRVTSTSTSSCPTPPRSNGWTRFAGRLKTFSGIPPGVEVYNTIVGYSILNQVNTTYNGYFSVTLKPWHERKKPEEKYRRHRRLREP